MFVLAGVGCSSMEDEPPAKVIHTGSAFVSSELSPRLMRRFSPLSAQPAGHDGPLVDLGRILYFDARLSASGTVSCNGCHPLDSYGTTDDVVSTGLHRGTRNAPTTYNAAGHFRQFWDGRDATIEEQAKGPFVNPMEMAMTPDLVVEKLHSIQGYGELFARAFPEQTSPVTFDNVGRAIGAFERGLLTPARWDRYLAGDRDALSRLEKDGAKLFANLGCMVCHTGEYLGGSMFEKVGVHAPWPNQADRGRGSLTGESADDMMFKVPSLRNVARTAPYFHDGSAATLYEAIMKMGRHQLGMELTDAEVRSIMVWMESLTGELPTSYIAAPTLPGTP
jgi:cytochrome c peroxidase